MSSAKSFGVCVCVLFINQKVMFRKKKKKHLSNSHSLGAWVLTLFQLS